MALYNQSFNLNFQNSTILVTPHFVSGRKVFNISFGNAQPEIVITRKKDEGGFYWVPVSNTGFKDVEQIGRCIVEYFNMRSNQAGSHAARPKNN
ncbi:hypothetical protein [Dyadobacter sandarakinus]|uniref:YjbR protein n=1 Tax=Dyadobacter sandarakinus TaxID=2747268 RepID=A0ABX7I191_9BACT|nr:hypothetical protein [Dyadobacter sandarakinus]QRQ99830.1 hypothetical protein HWI92_02305 [Dyadobacter sandarakinus]